MVKRNMMISIDLELYQKGKDMGLNFSQVLEDAILAIDSGEVLEGKELDRFKGMDLKTKNKVLLKETNDKVSKYKKENQFLWKMCENDVRRKYSGKQLEGLNEREKLELIVKTFEEARD